jgi:hypothetical protein
LTIVAIFLSAALDGSARCRFLHSPVDRREAFPAVWSDAIVVYVAITHRDVRAGAGFRTHHPTPRAMIQPRAARN